MFKRAEKSTASFFVVTFALFSTFHTLGGGGGLGGGGPVFPKNTFCAERNRPTIVPCGPADEGQEGNRRPLKNLMAVGAAAALT